MSITSYIREHGFTYESFGEMIGVTATTVYRYTTGDRFPHRSLLRKIEKLTDGKVTYNDFPQKKLNKSKKSNADPK